jgi:16S rRNA (cytosine1402-N4)-methyltransferase
LINSNYVNLKQELALKWIDKITWIYYDLWLSSLHVDESERWFSFREEGPLDMRFDRTSWKTAADIVNWYTRDDLYKIFRQYWEEPASNKIATAIVNGEKKCENLLLQLI